MESWFHYFYLVKIIHFMSYVKRMKGEGGDERRGYEYSNFYQPAPFYQEVRFMEKKFQSVHIAMMSLPKSFY